VPERVSPVERIRAQIDQLFTTDRDLGETLEEVARLGARLLLQTALEAEVTEFLGRDRYARGERARAGHRNGHAELTVKTTAGPITLERPKLRGTSQPFASRLLGKGVARSNALESLVIAGFVRGLSVRDVEASLADALGPQATLSKSTVSQVCQAIGDEFAAFRARDLSGIELDYCTWTGRTSRCIRARAPSRSWSPGASRPTARRFCWAWPSRRRGPRRLGRVPGRAGRAWAALAGAGHLRRRPGPDRRCRAGLPL
jgi:putative transposase